MQKMLMMVILGLTLSFNALAGIDAKLSFSTDNGKSWDTDFPLLQKAQEILIKVNWSVEENRDVKSNVLTTQLYSRECDFASANRGKQYWIPKNKPAWFQYLKKYYAGVRSSRPFVYRLNLGVRKADTMGKGNKWNKVKRKFLDAPLAACPAFQPGTYRFYIALKYRLKESNKKIELIKEFDITIEGDSKNSASAESSKKND